MEQDSPEQFLVSFLFDPASRRLRRLWSLRFSPIRQPSAHHLGGRCRIEVLRTAWPPPVAGLVPFIMVGIAQCLQVLLVAPDAAHILGRTGSRAVNADGLPDFRLSTHTTHE